MVNRIGDSLVFHLVRNNNVTAVGTETHVFERHPGKIIRGFLIIDAVNHEVITSRLEALELTPREGGLIGLN